MLTLFTKHGYFDLKAHVDGDIEWMDIIAQKILLFVRAAFKEALGDAAGIYRYASAAIPMDEALCQCA